MLSLEKMVYALQVLLSAKPIKMPGCGCGSSGTATKKITPAQIALWQKKTKTDDTLESLIKAALGNIKP